MKDFIYQIIETAGAIDAAGTRLLKPFGLTPMSYNILNLLSDAELNQRQLSDELIVVASSVTFQVRQLQQRGWLKRRRADRRTWLVSLTPAGEEVHRAATKEMDALVARLKLSPKACETALGTLREVKGQLVERETEKTD